MSKTSVFTTITPLPAGITRASVIETYHNHVEMIELNPLVVERFRCKAPSFAAPDEFHATWYTIKDKVSYLPGGLASGSVSYHACFHDLPDALQTHVFAPLGLDIKAKWSVGGSLPGEPRQAAELGLGIPKDGLYLREDVRMKCNIMMLSFVKKTFKESHSTLVDRLVQKAHILEAKAVNDGLAAAAQAPPPPPPGADHHQLRPASTMDSVAMPYRHASLYSVASSRQSVPSPLSSPGLPPAQAPPGYQTHPAYAADPRLSLFPTDFKGDPHVSMLPDQYAPVQQHQQQQQQQPHPHQQQQQQQQPTAFVAELPSEPKGQRTGGFASELPG